MSSVDPFTVAVTAPIWLELAVWVWYQRTLFLADEQSDLIWCHSAGRNGQKPVEVELTDCCIDVSFIRTRTSSPNATDLSCFTSKRTAPMEGYFMKRITLVLCLGALSVSTPAVLGQTNPTGLVSQGLPAIASSFSAGNVPTNANDGNAISTRWSAADGTYPQWWRVDLGSTQNIYRAVIDWFGAGFRSYTYEIDVSNDDTNYTTLVPSAASVGNTTNNFIATTRYVRVWVTSVTSLNGIAGFWECQLYGQATNGQNLVANPGFETGNFSGWTRTPAASGSVLVITNDNPHSGNYDAFFGANQGLNDTLSQQVLTQPGVRYDFNFWVNNSEGDLSSFLTVSWDGNPLLQITPSNSNFGWSNFDFSVIATGVTATISFAGRNAPSFVDLDDVSVVAGNGPYSFGDGIPDWWRIQYFGTAAATNSSSCATCDADGTGQNNFFKYVAGLDPTNPASVFVLSIAGVTNQPSQNNLFFTPLTSGRSYLPRFSTDLVSGSWLPLTSYAGPVTNGSQVTITDTNPIPPQEFYRMDISLP